MIPSFHFSWILFCVLSSASAGDTGLFVQLKLIRLRDPREYQKKTKDLRKSGSAKPEITTTLLWSAVYSGYR